MKQIIPPTNCPSCDSVLEFVNDQLFCKNDSCASQWDKKVVNFASTLKIKGLGPAAISKLNIQDYSELYDLTVEELQSRLSSVRLGEKLWTEIRNSESLPLVKLLPAFSIPLIVRTASQKVCNTKSHIEDISEKSCAEAGLGTKATANIINWLETEYYPNNYNNSLPFNWKNKIVEKQKVSGVVCISGRLNSFKTKAHAEQVLSEHGFVVKSSLTKDVTHLVNESGIESAKTRTARDRGVNIITNLQHLLED